MTLESSTTPEQTEPARTGSDSASPAPPQPAWRRHVWWVSGALGVVVFAAVWLLTPHGREVETAWEFVVKIFAYACLSAAVAFFPWVSTRLYGLLFVAFVFYTGYVVPRVSWFYYGDTQRLQADSFYTHLYLLLYPGLVLTVVAAYRLGGGLPGRCLKISGTGIILVFSGFLDIMWQVVNPVEIPDVIDAPHINLITGGPISFGATILFALAHVPLVVVLNLLPLDRWIEGGRFPRASRPR